METPLQIEFQGMEPVEMVQQEIERYVAGLEHRFGAATASLHRRGEGAWWHHLTGGLDEINIDLPRPQRQRSYIARTPRADERHGDIHFAVHDAFKRARRRLQDQARRLQGQVKVHEAQPTGTVTRLQNDFGFLETPDGRDVYFHRNSVLNGGFAQLSPGARVTFTEEMGEKGPQASTVRLIGKHSLRP